MSGYESIEDGEDFRQPFAGSKDAKKLASIEKRMIQIDKELMGIYS